jgi:hypothetical protein
MGTAFNPAKSSLASWDAFSDVDAFVDAVLAGPWRARSQHGAGRSHHWPEQHCARRSWRSGACASAACSIGQLCDIPFGTLYTLFARWTRLGLWRRLLNRLILAWRQACGDTPEPSAVIVDSRSCQSAPTCFGRGFDGGK